MGRVKDYFFDEILNRNEEPEPDPLAWHIDSLEQKIVAAQQDETLWAEITEDEIKALEHIVNIHKPTGETNERPF